MEILAERTHFHFKKVLKAKYVFHEVIKLWCILKGNDNNAPLHQSLNMLKSCLLNHGLSLFPSKSFFMIFVDYKLGTNESKGEISLNYE